MLSVELVRHRHDPSHKPHDRILLAVELFVAPEGHPNARDDEHRAEDVENPVELGDENRAEPDEHATHHQSAENAVEQHAMLAGAWDAEVLEDQDDDEDVVDAQ